MTWEVDPEPWDRLQLGDTVMPGVWHVKPDGIKCSVKIAKAHGEDGTRARSLGITTPRVVCTGQILSEQWEDLKRALKLISATTPGKERTPLTIVHPIPNALNINKVLLTEPEIDPPTASTPMICKLTFIQWFPAPKEIKTAEKRKKEEPYGPPEAQWGQRNPLYNINPPLSFSPGDDSVTDALRTGPDLPL